MYRITLVDVRNWQRIRRVRIEPPADAVIMLVCGDNEAGKSSLMNAFSALFGGAGEVPSEAVHHGADHADLYAELTDDEGNRYTLRRVIKPGSPPKIEVRGPAGLIRAPQTFLASITKGRFLNPLEFLAGDKADDERRRARALMQAAGLDTAELDARREVLYREREDIGRDRTRAKGEADRLPPPTAKPPTARPIADVTRDLVAVEGDLRTVTTLRVDETNKRRTVADAERACAELEVERARLEARIRAAAERRDAAQVELAAASEKVRAEASPDVEQALAARREALTKEHASADTLARWEANHRAIEDRRRAATETLDRLDAEYRSKTDDIGRIDAEKRAMLEAAPMPVEGLSVTADGIRYTRPGTTDSVPFASASGAVRLRTAVGVAAAMSPNCADIWVKDGLLLGPRNLDLLRELATERRMRLWIERGFQHEPGGIEIIDGVALPDGDDETDAEA